LDLENQSRRPTALTLLVLELFATVELSI